MGKPTGFMEYERQDKPAESPKERIKHFREFHTPLSKEEQERQGARCMACGVPFCQAGQMIMGMASGCPLHNLVPEWNDLIYHGNWEEAYYRLKKTNNFPFKHCHAMSSAVQHICHSKSGRSLSHNSYFLSGSDFHRSCRSVSFFVSILRN